MDKALLRHIITRRTLLYKNYTIMLNYMKKTFDYYENKKESIVVEENGLNYIVFIYNMYIKNII
jgi:hypothetical protein